VVFTTLTRRAMPLIRYRTGDISRIVPGRCTCGSLLPRLDRVRYRVDGVVPIGTQGSLSMAMLDEALFAIPGLIQFRATMRAAGPATLELTVYTAGPQAVFLQRAVHRALDEVPMIRRSVQAGALRVVVEVAGARPPDAGAKRRIEWIA